VVLTHYKSAFPSIKPIVRPNSNPIAEFDPHWLSGLTCGVGSFTCSQYTRNGHTPIKVFFKSVNLIGILNCSLLFVTTLPVGGYILIGVIWCALWYNLIRIVLTVLYPFSITTLNRAIRVRTILFGDKLLLSWVPEHISHLRVRGEAADDSELCERRVPAAARHCVAGFDVFFNMRGRLKSRALE